VETDVDGIPRALKTKRRQNITAVEDRWRLDDEWWRTEPISRLYYAVRLASGHRAVLYKNIISGEWYKQDY
jgi:hypothetical protein